MTFLNRKIGKSLRGKYYSYEGRIIGNYPIIELSLDDQRPFINLVEKMIQLIEDIAYCKTPMEKKLLEIQLKKTDDELDTLVYELYGLTDEEIAIVENEAE